jgi:hypothetical protein
MCPQTNEVAVHLIQILLPVRDNDRHAQKVDKG